MIADNEKIAQRYISVIVIVILLAILIVVRAAGLMTFGRKGWSVVARQFEADSVRVQPQRGSILSDEGMVMVSSTPEYELVFKYKEGAKDAERQHKRDSALRADMKGICDTLAMLLPGRSSDEYRRLLRIALNNKKNYTKLYPKRLPYNQYKEVRDFLGKGNGFVFDEVMVRKNTYDRLAARTLGRWDIEAGKPRDGIELAYDSLLCGKQGLAHRRKVMDTYYEFIDVAPQNGCDIVTTLNVNIQDIAQRALMKQVSTVEADAATAIVLETKTGDIKAIVNLTRSSDGTFLIGDNYAFTRRIEQGSTFKPASIMVALEDGKITLTDSVDTHHGYTTFYGHSMKDEIGEPSVKHVPEILQYSSNIGTMTLIDRHYKSNTVKFLKGLQRMNLTEDFAILPGMPKSQLHTEAQIKGNMVNTLWMAIGYGSQILPINIVAFYNAIANDGKMMKPRLVKEIRRDGKVIERFDTEVVNKAIASDSTIKHITKCLIGVVNEPRGTGRNARSEHFLVAGKTGTAQIKQGREGTIVGYWLNFCGFFPADNPEYSCIVCINKKTPFGGGGGNSAPVFGEIAEQVMAYKKTTEVGEIDDSLALRKPDARMIKKGYYSVKTDVVLDGLKIRDKSLRGEDYQAESGVVPNVVGMGARDAVYAMESAGIRVRLEGIGKVQRQSAPAGSTIRRNMTVELILN
jgi:cell division protein FtsI (penicillin-binding protein 3)